jgi:DNA-directed RNA polymerase sigma subunit (sigma70/sigma32)
LGSAEIAVAVLVPVDPRLLHALAARYTGRGVRYEHLVREGTLGLIRAGVTFEHRRHVRCATYAVCWIR